VGVPRVGVTADRPDEAVGHRVILTTLEFGTDVEEVNPMADDRMAVLEVLRKAAGDGDLDFLREGLTMLTQRNGYRERRWDTRVGTIDLHIPKLRDGTYFRARPASDRIQRSFEAVEDQVEPELELVSGAVAGLHGALGDELDEIGVLVDGE
jgi:hypothetical protein